MYDVIALGELLIDFTPYGKSNQNNDLLEVNPGGAPCNVLAILSKLGYKTGFIGKVGNDGFGRLLKNTLEDEGISTNGLVLSDEYNTTAAFVHLDENGERSFSFYRNMGADEMLTEEEINVDMNGLVLSDEYNTTAAFVHLDENGERSFSFYRNMGADEMLTEEEINVDMIKNSKIFHFGTLSMTKNPAKSATKKAVDIARENGVLVSFDPNYRPALWKDEKIFHFGTLSMTKNPAKSATKKAVDIARENGVLVSFDPNYRPALWKDEDLAKEAIEYGLSKCDILKISDNELELITNINDVNEAIIEIKNKYNIKLILVTLGEKGSMYWYNNCIGYRRGFEGNVVDTTGAGDTFHGALLSKIVDKDLKNINIAYLDKALDFANAAGSVIVGRKGSLKSMPTLDEINDVLGVSLEV